VRAKYFLAIIALALTGCVSQYKVVVEFSPNLRDHFAGYPTIEVDIAAVTDSEADEIKQMGVEQYFAPGSGIRQQLHAQTCFFSREEQYSYVLPSRAPVWKTWRLKKPGSILVIASLPPDQPVNQQADPRFLLIRMMRSYVLARTINILVEPQRIKQIVRSPSGTSGDMDPEGGQWVETRQRR
jgi:hypothetical protein